MKIALNGVKDKLTDKETETLFDDLDVDQNGNISFDEFIHMWTK